MSRRNVAQHTEETKKRALKRLSEGVSSSEVCKMFGIGKSTLDKWRRGVKK